MTYNGYSTCAKPFKVLQLSIYANLFSGNVPSAASPFSLSLSNARCHDFTCQGDTLKGLTGVNIMTYAAEHICDLYIIS